MTPYEQSQIYKYEIEAWHLFYESFKESSDAILLSRGVLVSMCSEIIKAKKLNPNNPKIKQSKSRVDILLQNLDLFEKLNNRCAQLQNALKESNKKRIEIENENKKLTKTIENFQL